MSLFQPQPIHIQHTTQTSRSFVNTPVVHKTSSRKKQRKQHQKGQRASVRQLAGPHNKMLKKNNDQKYSIHQNMEIIENIKPQTIPNNESWYNKMNAISSY